MAMHDRRTDPRTRLPVARPELVAPVAEHAPSAKYLTPCAGRPELRSSRDQVRHVLACALLHLVRVGGTAIRDLARACSVSEAVAHRWLRGETNVPLALLSARQTPIDDRISLAWAALVESAQTPRDLERVARALQKFGGARLDEALAKEDGR